MLFTILFITGIAMANILRQERQSEAWIIKCVMNCVNPIEPDSAPHVTASCPYGCNESYLLWACYEADKFNPIGPKTEWLIFDEPLELVRPYQRGDIEILPKPIMCKFYPSNEQNPEPIAEFYYNFREHKVEITFTCKSNCDYKPNENVEFQVECDYRLTDEPEPKEKCNFKMDYTLQPAGEYSTSGQYNEILTVPGGTYQKGQQVKVTAIPTYGRGQGTTIINYNDGVHTCGLNPTNGVSGETEFSVTCSHPNGMIFAVYNDDVLLKNFKTPVIENLWLTKGSPSRVKVVVLFNGKEIATYDLEANVEGLPPHENGDVQSAAKQRILSYEDPKSFHNLIANKHYNKVVQLASLLLDALNETDYAHMRKHILGFVNKVSDKLGPIQLITLLEKELKRLAITESFDFEMAANILREAVTRFQDTVLYPKGHIPDDVVKDFTQNSLDIISELLVENKLVWNSIHQNDDKQITDYENDYDLEPKRIYGIWHHGRGTFALLEAVKNLMFLALNHEHILDTMTTPHVTYTADTLPDRKPGQATTQINIPKSSSSYIKFNLKLLDELMNLPQKVIYAAALFSEDPFWWLNTHLTIVSDIIMFTLGSVTEQVKTVKNPVDIYFETRGGVLGSTRANFDRKGPTRHVIQVKPRCLLSFIFRGTGSGYYAYVSRHIAQSREIMSKGIFIKPNAVVDYQFEVGTDEFVSLGFFGTISAQYSFDIGMYSCISWDGHSWQWAYDCKTMKASQTNVIHCQCNHLSLFAISFLVPPNRIELPNLPLHIMLRDNPVLLIALSMFTLIYLALLAYAHRKDKKLNLLRKILPLADIVPGDSNKYVIVIFTGDGPRSGTSSNVVLEIIGTESSSRKHVIRSCLRPMLQRGYEDWVVIFTPEPLGVPSYIRLSTHVRGENPHWYCEMVVVKDMATKQDYLFVVNQWFSLIYGDGCLKKCIPLSTSTRHRKQLSKKLMERLKNDHLWLSIFSRSSQSGFSCKERLTAAYCVLLMSMLTSAMFFGLPGKTDDGNFGIGVKEAVIIVESLVISVPVSVTLVLLFKNSRPKWSYYSQVKTI